MKKILNLILLISIIISLSSCKEITKKEIINDLKMSEAILPMPVDTNTLCVDLYYDKIEDEIIIKYITKDSCQNKRLQQVNFVELIQNNKEHNLIRLLKRCANADLNIHSITYSTQGDTLVNTMMTPEEYQPKRNKKKQLNS